MWETAQCCCTNCFSYFGKQNIFLKLERVFQHSVFKKDDRTDRNNYLVITYYQLQNTTLSNTLLSSLTAQAAEFIFNQEYGFGFTIANV